MRELTLTNKEILEKFQEIKKEVFRSVLKDKKIFEEYVEKFVKELGTNANNSVVAGMMIAYCEGFMEGTIFMEYLNKKFKRKKK